ncbi:MAG TPA: hypothetical protein VJ739_00935 [Gemmataceae bacterium]|nr:hypothetical protein [Gemmataceae bacterium]
MTLDEALLEKLAEWRCDSRRTLTTSAEGGPWSVALTADRADQLGCLVWELALRRATPPGLPLGAWAGRTAGRVTGLLEPLKVVEVDDPRNEAMLRSDKPARRGDELFYYELLLKGNGEAQLRRYHASRRGPARREQVAFALTHEALAKLVADLTADA